MAGGALLVVAAAGGAGGQVQVSFYSSIPGAAPSAGSPLVAGAPLCSATVSAIGFDFNNGGVRTALCPSSAGSIQYSFSARFVGTLNVASAGNYSVDLNTDDGNVFTVGGTVKSNNWHDQGSGPGSILLTLAAGATPFTLDYYSNSYGGAYATLNLSTGVTLGAPLSAVPEPGTVSLMAGGLLALGGAAVRRRRAPR